MHIVETNSWALTIRIIYIFSLDCIVMKLRTLFSYCSCNWQREIEELRFKVASVSSTPDVAAQKLKEAHLEKMNALEGQVRCESN